MLNFAELQSVDKANTKTGVARGQNWLVRFKRTTRTKDEKTTKNGRFYIANSVWESMSLEDYSLRQFNQLKDPKASRSETNPVISVVLATTDNDKGIFLKRTIEQPKDEEGNAIGDPIDQEKGRNFKSDMLEQAMVEAGILSAVSDVVKEPYQYLEFQATDTPAGAPEWTHGFYNIVAVAAPVASDNGEEADDDEPSDEEVVAAAKPAAKMAVEADVDDF